MEKNILETKSLILRKAQPSDVDDLFYNYWSRSEPSRLMLWKPITSLKEAGERIEKTIAFQNGNPAFVVTLKASGEVIGLAGFKEVGVGEYADVGIGLGPRFVHKGYGSEIISALVSYLFLDLKAEKITMSAMNENLISIYLFMKFGFKFKKREFLVRDYDGLEYLNCVYELTRAEFIKRLSK